MLTYQERKELAEYGICFTWSENLGQKDYPRGFGFFPLTEQVNDEQSLRQKEYPKISQQEVDDLIKTKFGYFVFDPITGEVHKKKKKILSGLQTKVGNNTVYIPQVAPIENFNNEKTIAATHGIIDGQIHEITERNNHAFVLSDGNTYFKDNSLNEAKVIWVRMIVTNYDGIKYATW